MWEERGGKVCEKQRIDFFETVWEHFTCWSSLCFIDCCKWLSYVIGVIPSPGTCVYSSQVYCEFPQLTPQSFLLILLIILFFFTYFRIKFQPGFFHISVLGLGHALVSYERDQSELEMEKAYYPMLVPDDCNRKSIIRKLTKILN